MDPTPPTVQYGYLDRDFPSHGHHQWEIHLFTAGRGFLVQDGQRWSLVPGSLALTPPRHLHQLAVDEPLSFYYVRFDDEPGLRGVLRRLVDRQRDAGTRAVDPGLVAEAGRLKQKLDSPSADRVASGHHGFRAWLYDLAGGGDEAEADGVDKALVWLRHNLHRRVALDDLARAAGLDRFGFCRRFKAKTGLTPLAYVHRSKVEAAGFLLAGTDLPLAEVAQRFGFSDEFHFGKVFRRWRGQSPGRWRRSLPPSASGISDGSTGM